MRHNPQNKKKQNSKKNYWFKPVQWFAKWSRYRYKTNGVIWCIFFCFVAVASLIVYKLYVIQVVHGEEFYERVEYQHERIVNTHDSIRGDIYLTYKDGGKLLAATDREYQQLIINNKRVRDLLMLRKQLREHIEHDEERLENILSKKDDPYEILVDRLTQEEIEYLKENRIPGVELHARAERYYPLGKLVSEVVGFISFQGNELRGTYGLEKYYDNILRRNGEVKNISLVKSLFTETEEGEAGNETSIEKNISKEGSLVSTIEPQVQEYVMKELESIDTRFDSKYSAAIVMDPATGEILAMGSTQSFDPNLNRKHYRNVTIEDRYEFGSIMKPISIAMALDAGVVDEDFTYHDKGYLELNERTIYNYDRRGRGVGTTIQTVLAQSLNTGAAEIAMKLGASTFMSYIKKIGLSDETGIDLPYEIYGNTDNIDTGRMVELATASYGQGVAVSLIEMAQAWSVLANDGVLQTPHIVSEIEYGDLIPARNIPPGGNVSVFSEQTTDILTDLLVNIVDDTATFQSYSLPQHSIAIKTGTAQLANPEGGYYEDEFLHSFAGYLPAQAKQDEQKFVMVWFTFKPQGVRYSSTTLKDPFFNTAQFLINYYNLPPDRNLSGNIQ